MARVFFELPKHGKLLELNPTEDISRLNEKLFRLGADPRCGEAVLRHLGASEEVASRIRGANAAALGTAIQCRVPLLEFSDVLDPLMARSPSQWQWESGPAVCEEVGSLACFMLCVAHDLALRNVTMVKEFFNTSRLSAERLGDLSVANREVLATRASGLIRLRAGRDAHLWNLLLIGDRCTGTSASEVARRAVELSMARRQEASG
jgi:hypothetical protein